jgi:hypothetical protein
LHTKEINVGLQDKQCICLVKLIDANRKNNKKGFRPVSRMLIEEAHYCTFIAAVFTLRPASVPIISTMFDTVMVGVAATISITLSKLWWLLITSE